MKLHLPLDANNAKQHEIMMTDVNYLIDQYWQYLVEHYKGTPTEVTERLVYSFSDAWWAAVLRKTIKVGECPLKTWKRKLVNAVASIRDLWEMGE